MRSSDLERLERTLSPQQAALHFYAPLLEAATPVDFILQFFDARQGETDSVSLRRVKASTTAAMRGQSREAILAAERRAISEYYFLYSLIGRVNDQAAHNWEAWTLRAAFAAHLSLHLSTLWVLAPSDLTEDRFRAHERLDKEQANARDFLTQSTAIISGTLGAAEQVSRTYAAGTPVLFAGARELLHFGETCLALLEESLQETYPHIGTERYAQTDQTTGQLASLWVDQARTDLYEMRGEDAAGEAMLRARVERMRS